MEKSIILLIGALIIGFSFTASFYSLLSSKEDNKNTFLPFYLIFAIGSIALYFINPNNYDALNPITFYDLAAVIVISGALYAFSSIEKLKGYELLIIIAGSIICSILTPQDFLLIEGHVNIILDRIIIATALIALSFCYRYLNGVDGIVAIQTSGITSGIVLFYFFGALPFLTSSIGALVAGAALALLLYTWFPAKINLNNEESSAIGFIVAWLLLKVSQEGLATCALILVMVYLFEIIWAFGKTLLPFENNKDILSNTNYVEANISGLSPSNICASISKIQLLFIIFASLQLYSPNIYSLPIFTLITTAWFMSRLRNWQEPIKTIREINRDVLEDIKDGFKNISNKDDK